MQSVVPDFLFVLALLLDHAAKTNRRLLCIRSLLVQGFIGLQAFFV